MNVNTIVKINFLLLALFVVLFFMAKVDNGAMKSGLEALFGAPQVTSQPASR